MKIQKFNEFENSQSLNEGKLINTVTVTYEINYSIDELIWVEASMKSEKDMAETIASDLNLKSGSITFEKRIFEVSGETYNGKTLYVFQIGEFDMYGGPYTPKLKTPKILVNNKNILPIVKKAFKDTGSDSTNIDVSRTDIWGDII